MKGLSVFAFILGISAFANALARNWVLDLSPASGSQIALDVLIGVGCWGISIVLWRAHVTRSLRAGSDPLA